MRASCSVQREQERRGGQRVSASKGLACPATLGVSLDFILSERRATEEASPPCLSSWLSEVNVSNGERVAAVVHGDPCLVTVSISLPAWRAKPASSSTAKCTASAAPAALLRQLLT